MRERRRSTKKARLVCATRGRPSAVFTLVKPVYNNDRSLPHRAGSTVGRDPMNKLTIALLLCPLMPGLAAAQANAPAAPDAKVQAGKSLWEGPSTQCRNCHGS